MRPGAAVGDHTVTEDDQASLGQAREREEGDGDVQVGAGEGRTGGQVPPQGVDKERCERLVAA